MFSKKHMSVIDWWIYYVLMIIPLVNIIVFLMILFSKNVNKSLKSFVWASILPIIIVIILALTTGIFASLLGN